MKKTQHKPMKKLIALILALAVLFSLSSSLSPTAYADTVSRVIFYTGNPELVGQKDVVFKIFGSDKLNGDKSLSHFYDLPAFAGDEYVFKGWYHSNGYTKNASKADIPVDFENDTYPSRGGDYHIYAKWIKVGEVAKDSRDTNTGVESYRGFGLSGVQIRTEAPDGLRYVACVSEELLEKVVNISKIQTATAEAGSFGVRYGFVVSTEKKIKTFIERYKVFDTASYRLLYKGEDVNGKDTTGKTRKAESDYRYITNIDCTSRAGATASCGTVERDHRNFSGYRLYTLAVTYDDEPEKKDEKLDARAYMRYYDANGKLRVFYNDYRNDEGITFFGGCNCSYNQAVNNQPNENIDHHQCTTAVRKYIDYLKKVPYNPLDYSYTYFDSHTVDIEYRDQHQKPISLTVDEKKYTNLIPNEAAPFFTSTRSGTITFRDQVRWIDTTYDITGDPYPYGDNTRDIGGWSCAVGADGKPCTVRYGMIYRGAEPNPSDTDLMVNKLGIKTELQLLPIREQRDRAGRSVWGVDWVGNDMEGYSVYGIEYGNPGTEWANQHLWTLYLNTVFDSVANDKPIYIHCGVGADRTGAVMIMIESILGVTEGEVCQDYELTCFASISQRYRTREGCKDLIAAIKAEPLEAGLDDTLEGHAISFALRHGTTREQINAFRNACIVGNPVQI